MLAKYGVELIGADIDAIQRGEDRQRFKEIVRTVGGDTPASVVCHTLAEVVEFAATVGVASLTAEFHDGWAWPGLAGTLKKSARWCSVV